MELIQKNKQKSEALGSDLRHGSRKSVRRRRGVFGLFLAANASMGVIALYQLGILKHVPEPRLPRFDSDNITGSAKAYSLLATPDAVLAMGSYAATMTLAAMGSPDRANEQPLLPIALAAKVGFDAVVAAKYTLEEWRKHRTLCFWCLLASAATFASVPLVIPEARRALRRLT
ncbi:MAG TPA: vitamin K epoxide reductase family protein [Candidatus Acidoferrales bacterium]|nr:vitamin K epoxide reductase family protein [Candidatus Acidoferrales bacterium]